MRDLGKNLVKTGIRGLSSSWLPYSRLILAGDSTGWVLDWEIRELRAVAKKLGIRTLSKYWNHSATPQAIFHAGQFFLANDEWLASPHRVGFSYFHGLPNTGDKIFDAVYSGLCRHQENITRIQVSHSQMRDSVLQTGIDPSKVHLIPIGIN